MAKFELTINADNGALEANPSVQIAHILFELSRYLLSGDLSSRLNDDKDQGGDLRDAGGDTVGEWYWRV